MVTGILPLTLTLWRQKELNTFSLSNCILEFHPEIFDSLLVHANESGVYNFFEE